MAKSLWDRIKEAAFGIPDLPEDVKEDFGSRGEGPKEFSHAEVVVHPVEDTLPIRIPIKPEHIPVILAPLKRKSKLSKKTGKQTKKKH